MIRTIPFRFGALGAAGILLALTAPALAYTGQNLAGHAKVTITQARQFALKAHTGKITDEELEREAGGSGLRYSFDIRTGSRTHEVGVDAATGKVLESKAEGPHPD
ncbi:PepSY domain-containing protein [uncultured Bradyrhizobium sp.]|uniref:PepSY domain-containing protein n=1 Tax=uncultured Bradyrhizobium sp. TaxID=199684 RepID=UPI0026033DA0|nr:PepSY domain-containing protein [uncultured Bradyrhizobium sp.]